MISTLISLITSSLFKNTLFSLCCMYVGGGWWLISSFMLLWSEMMFDMITVLNLLRLVLYPNMWSLRIFHVHLRRRYILLLCNEMFCKYQLKLLGLLCCLRSLFPAWLFCLEDLPIDDSGLLKSPTVTALLSICSLMSSKIFFIYFGAPLLGVYTGSDTNSAPFLITKSFITKS